MLQIMSVVMGVVLMLDKPARQALGQNNLNQSLSDPFLHASLKVANSCGYVGILLNAAEEPLQPHVRNWISEELMVKHSPKKNAFKLLVKGARATIETCSMRLASLA
jgi:hypothetical protein